MWTQLECEEDAELECAPSHKAGSPLCYRVSENAVAFSILDSYRVHIGGEVASFPGALGNYQERLGTRLEVKLL